jgi:hypothetical protein
MDLFLSTMRDYNTPTSISFEENILILKSAFSNTRRLSTDDAREQIVLELLQRYSCIVLIQTREMPVVRVVRYILSVVFVIVIAGRYPVKDLHGRSKCNLLTLIHSFPYSPHQIALYFTSRAAAIPEHDRRKVYEEEEKWKSLLAEIQTSSARHLCAYANA